MVQVDLRMYCFHESEPLSRPPPVSFSPPKAPPISAPDGPMFTLTIPQSLPLGPVHLKMFYTFWVKMELDNPYGTPLLMAIPSSKDSHLITYMTGAKSSSLRILACLSMATIVGSTKNPFLSFKALPPWRILPPYFLISSIPSS